MIQVKACLNIILVLTKNKSCYESMERNGSWYEEWSGKKLGNPQMRYEYLQD
jgi:hypothetical protein